MKKRTQNAKMKIRESREFSEMKNLLRGFRRSPDQLNQLFSSDCEIIKFRNSYLCISTDSLAEEIDIGLYRDPYTWGWMTVASNISDLAASGAQPIGLLVANQWQYGTTEKVKTRFFKGAQHALIEMGVSLLGGDSGSAKSHSHAGTIIGSSQRKPLTRIGVRPGDYVIALQKKRGGLGPALAYQLLFKKTRSLQLETAFRPTPDLKLAHQIARLARASIDTSDGIATCLDTIKQLNQVGFSLTWNENWPSPIAMKCCRKLKLNPAILMMGDHGDFQTILFISQKNLQMLSRFTKDYCVLGVATKHLDISLRYQDKTIRLPTEKIVQCPREVSAIKQVTIEINDYLNAGF